MNFALGVLVFCLQQNHPYLERYCVECHDSETKKGNFDLTALKVDYSNPENFARWVKVYDRLEAGEMPPKKKPAPPLPDTQALLGSLKKSLLSADRARVDPQGRTAVRRLTRGEYENTVRDLFGLTGIPLESGLPADGMAGGFDKNSEALDLSHVNLSKYVEAADQILDMAIATTPKAPTPHLQHISLAKYVGHILGNGDAVLLQGKQLDPLYPPAGEQGHLDQGAHERMGSFNRGSTVGLFRHEDESFKPYFQEFACLYPGRYKLKASFWSFQWDKGKILPSRGTEAARLSIVHMQDDGRGGGHPSTVLGYYDAPSMESRVHETEVWLNFKDAIGFNTASLAPVANYNRKGRALAFSGPAIAVDWLDIEGPIHDVWPPAAHRALFGDLPITEFKPADHPGVRAPRRVPPKQGIVHVTNKPDL
ncbi:MAG TPA: DUF1587 domain-containing protein, partial [Planctomycetota bacterium]|nr:DUF1587 domain-containing protein [Planctomycetota bacterium]